MRGVAVAEELRARTRGFLLLREDAHAVVRVVVGHDAVLDAVGDGVDSAAYAVLAAA